MFVCVCVRARACVCVTQRQTEIQGEKEYFSGGHRLV